MEVLSAPVTVQYEVTYNCNQRCDFCYNVWKESDRKLPRELSKSEALKVVDECGNAGVIRFIFTGGEPFLRRDFQDLLLRATEYNMFIHINTNGTLILSNSKILKTLSERAINTQISFLGLESHDRITHLKGSSNMALCAVDTLMEAGVPTSINIIVSDQPKEEIDKTVAFFKDKGLRVGLSRALPRVPSGGKPLLKEVAKDLYKILVKYDCRAFSPLPLCAISEEYDKYKRLPGSGCSAGYYLCVIGPNGRIRGCTHAPDEYANVAEVGLSKAWESLEPYRKMLTSPPEPCNTCGKVSECRAFCREVIRYYGCDSWIDRPFPKEKLHEKIGYSTKEQDFLLNTRFKIYNRAKIRKETFGSVIVSGRKILPLNETATLMLNLLDSGLTGNEITEKMMNLYPGVERNTLRKDTLDFITFSYIFQLIEKVV